MTVTILSHSKARATADNIPLATCEEHVAKMRAAADKHRPDYSEAERQAWAERTVDAYLKRGLLRLEAVS